MKIRKRTDSGFQEGTHSERVVPEVEELQCVFDFEEAAELDAVGHHHLVVGQEEFLKIVVHLQSGH